MKLIDAISGFEIGNKSDYDRDKNVGCVVGDVFYVAIVNDDVLRNVNDDDADDLSPESGLCPCKHQE